MKKFFTVEEGEDKNKTVILIATPSSGKEIISFNRYLAPALGQLNMEDAPVGLFWRYGNKTDLVDYLTKSPVELISSRSLYENWQKAQNCLLMPIPGNEIVIDTSKRIRLIFPDIIKYSLPKEIWKLIFLEASEDTHPFTLQKVCKEWRNIIRQEAPDLNAFMKQCMLRWEAKHKWCPSRGWKKIV